MNRLLFLPVLFSVIPVGAQEPDIQCPGKNTIEMRWCASKARNESREALKEKLSLEILEKWEQATKEACEVAYAPYLQGTIYPQMVATCDDRLNRALLEELKGLGR